MSYWVLLQDIDSLTQIRSNTEKDLECITAYVIWM